MLLFIVAMFRCIQELLFIIFVTLTLNNRVFPYCHLYYYSSGFNKVTLQSTHWSIQTLLISGGDSSCSWVFYSCTGPKCGVGVDLVDCNAVGGGHVATSIDQSVRISTCGALALEEYKQSASVQPLLCNS